MLELSSKLLVNSFFVLVFTLLYGKYVSKKLKIDIKVIFLIFLTILLITTMSFKINKLAELSFKYITLLFLFKILYKESFSKVGVENNKEFADIISRQIVSLPIDTLKEFIKDHKKLEDYIRKVIKKIMLKIN